MKSTKKLEIITNCYEQAKPQILIENRTLLDTITNYLLEVETLNKQDIDEIVKTGKLGWWEERKLQPKSTPVGRKPTR